MLDVSVLECSSIELNTGRGTEYLYMVRFGLGTNFHRNTCIGSIKICANTLRSTVYIFESSISRVKIFCVKLHLHKIPITSYDLDKVFSLFSNKFLFQFFDCLGPFLDVNVGDDDPRCSGREKAAGKLKADASRRPSDDSSASRNVKHCFPLPTKDTLVSILSCSRNYRSKVIPHLTRARKNKGIIRKGSAYIHVQRVDGVRLSRWQ